MRRNPYNCVVLLAMIASALIAVSAGEALSGAEGRATERYAEADEQARLIVPGERVGQFTFGATRAELVQHLGKPYAASCDGKTCPLDKRPQVYYLHFGALSFLIKDGRVRQITVHSPRWKLANGVSIGASEDYVKKTLGLDFRVRDATEKDFLMYEELGVNFEIDKKKRTVMEINVVPVIAAATGSAPEKAH